MVLKSAPWKLASASARPLAESTGELLKTKICVKQKGQFAAPVLGSASAGPHVGPNVQKARPEPDVPQNAPCMLLVAVAARDDVVRQRLEN